MARKTGSGNGLSAHYRTGMKKKELEQGGAGRGDTVYIRAGDTVPVQFLQSPDEFMVYSQHSWQEDGRWHFVPCLGDECPLCEDESDDRSKKGYQWACNVFNVKEKKVQILKGGKDLGSRIYFRYERKPAMFTKRVFEITKFATKPITYDCGVGEDKPVKTDTLKLIDLEEWLEKEASEFFGDLAQAPSSLDEPEPGDECPECGTELDEDGECSNPDCEWDPQETTAEAVDNCPECDEPLNEDGECENPECEAYEGEDEPEPEPRRKAKAKPGRKAGPVRRPARR